MSISSKFKNFCKKQRKLAAKRAGAQAYFNRSEHVRRKPKMRGHDGTMYGTFRSPPGAK